MPSNLQPGSSSIRQPDYWWYRARTQLLEAVLAPHAGSGRLTARRRQRRRAQRRLAAGRAPQRHPRPASPRGSSRARACAGRRPRCRSQTARSTWCRAFDVVEHCEDERLAIAELTRVLEPGGRMLLSVPAYQWAWSRPRRASRPSPPLHAAAAGPARRVGGAARATGRRTRSARCSRSSPPSDSCGGCGAGRRRTAAARGVRWPRPGADAALRTRRRGCWAAATYPSARRCSWRRPSRR